MTTAFLFAGQGSQSVGMTKNIAQVCPAAQQLFQKANSILGFDLANLCFNGPQERLNRTDISQPALLVAGLACFEFFKTKKDITPLFCTGLSLGEYTALVYAETLDFEEALKIVKLRGELMQQDCDKTPSGMVSVLGLEASKVEMACNDAKQSGIVCVSNANAPGQVVISGEKAALEHAAKLCMENGAKRTIPLRVAGAYHSPVMLYSQIKLNETLVRIEFKDPQVPFVSSVTGEIIKSGQAIKDLMMKQITSAVLWEKSVRTMTANGVNEFYEFGPGKVLSGLVKRIQQDTVCYSVEEPTDLA